MPRGVRVRNLARRSLPAIGAGLALLTVAAAQPASAQPVSAQRSLRSGPARNGPAHTGLSVAFERVHDEITSWGWDQPGNIRSEPHVVNAANLLSPAGPGALPRLHGLLQADLLVVAPTSLPRDAAAACGGCPVWWPPSRSMRPGSRWTASSSPCSAWTRWRSARSPPSRPLQSEPLWRDVAAGGVAVSYTMGKLDKLSLSQPLRVAGRSTEDLRVAGFGTVGIAGVDAVVSDQVARSLGIPAGNAIVVSAPHGSSAR